MVHENHGLGVYRGIEKMEVDGVVKSYIKIEYAGKSNLYILAPSWMSCKNMPVLMRQRHQS